MYNASVYPSEELHILGVASTENVATEDMLNVVAWNDYILGRDLCSWDILESHQMDLQLPKTWDYGEVPYQHNMVDEELWKNGHDNTGYM